MIYLIQQTYYNSETEEVIDLLKVGYTDNIDRRLKSYYSQAPLTKLLGVKEGDTKLETLFHEIFKDLRFPDEENKGYREWFYFSQDIIDKFNSYGTKAVDLGEIKPGEEEPQSSKRLE